MAQRNNPTSLTLQQKQFNSINQSSNTTQQDSALALLLPLLVLLSSLLFLLLLFLIFLILLRRRRSTHPSSHSSSSRRHHLLRLNDSEGPLDLSSPEDDHHFHGGIQGIEARWLDSCSTATRNGYLRAKMYQTHHPPNSLPTDITLSQFLSIQEKGVSAWAFEPDYDSNPSLPILVQSRTEIIFLEDGAGMSEEEGGGVCVQSNLPLPKLNEVYYFECKIYDKPPGSEIAIGLATKPYPSFRLPGWNRLSIGYFSADGFKSHNYPFTATSYGTPLKEGDVLGVGYRPRTGSVFFTRNGKKLEDAFVGLHRFNLFPTIGATGPASVHVNLGQAGFVFIEANVKKWGLAPMAGTLAPPPAYGHQMGSILLASAQPQHEFNHHHHHHHHQQQPPPSQPQQTLLDYPAPDSPPSQSHSHSSQPYSDHYDGSEDGGTSADRSSGETVRVASHSQRQHRRRHRLVGYTTIDTHTAEPLPHNPPTPRPLDISLERLNNHPASARHPRPSVSHHYSDDDGDAGNDDDDSNDGRPGYHHHHHHHSQSQQQQQQHEQQHPVCQASRSRSRPRSQAAPEMQPPQYAPIDPYKYAAGVAEVMLSDQFQGTSHSFNIAPPRSSS
ncbi:hypothetical protein PCANC_16587 [Puccinia coronata f. sp. avenae]|uniref:B30.2/SPRY domain-containing protein n=1 Tax=Puccinia coronata f. sp. avenae TaxID=200324 RepID=A0A2N5SEZ6_9BASI|nr:hypothetical protein PCASD_21056 [Puccinia coronata f. sp. avenae]PLW16013.1 hypothetical protein PCANC_18041 [Puccinia coronata f. sp. avenae]PLW38834.1 hypothetical protein PCANC_16587 [Puccinia coronata f. sp. avenae]